MPGMKYLLFAGLLLTATWASAQAYKCGSAYQDHPCAGGSAVDLHQPPSAEDERRKRCGGRTVHLAIGMPESDLACAGYGNPDEVNVTATAAGTSRQYVYRMSPTSTHYLYFTNGVLTALQY